MGERYFEEYGFLDWLSPKDYYADNWRYVCTDMESQDMWYDIVRHEETQEYRYTTI